MLRIVVAFKGEGELWIIGKEKSFMKVSVKVTRRMALLANSVM